MKNAQVLLCKCGVCAHWEIVKSGGGGYYIVCMSCEKDFHADISIPLSEHLEWAHIDAKRKKWKAHED